jgi:hypothetical protein
LKKKKTDRRSPRNCLKNVEDGYVSPPGHEGGSGRKSNRSPFKMAKRRADLSNSKDRESIDATERSQKKQA